jgi:hypothetical protein
MTTKHNTDNYNFRDIAGHIAKIEEAAKEIKKLSCGMKAIDINTNAILVYAYILNQNVTDVLDMDI